MVPRYTFSSPGTEYRDQNGLVLADLTLTEVLTISNCTGVLISNITVNHESIAIIIVDSVNVTVTNCYTANSIRAINSADVTIDYCTFVDNNEYYASISAENSTGITVKSCSIACGYIKMEDSSDIIIISNTFTWSTVDESNYNEITISESSGIAVINNTLIPSA